MYPMKEREKPAPSTVYMAALDHCEQGDSLRGRLHAEADRILKWKVSSEIQRQQQATQLEEARQLQRNKDQHLCEMRQQYATVLAQMHSERQRSEQAVTSAHNTRTVAVVVERQTAQLQEMLQHCESEAITLKQQRQLMHSRIQEVKQNIEELTQTHRSKVQQLEKQAADVREEHQRKQVEAALDRDCLVEEIQGLGETLKENRDKLSRLSALQTETELNLTGLQEKHRVLEEEIHVKTLELDDTGEKLMQTSKSLEDTQEHLSVSETQLKEAQGTNAVLEEQLNLFRAESQNLSELLSEANEKYEVVSKTLDDETETRKNKEAELGILFEEKQKVQSFFDSANERIVSLSEEIDCLTTQKNTLKETLESTTDAHASYKQEMLNTIKQMELELYSKTKHIEEIKLQLEDVVEKHTIECKRYNASSEQVCDLHKTLEELESVQVNLKESLDEKEGQVTHLSDQLDKATQKSLADAQQNKEHERRIFELTEQVSVGKEEISSTFSQLKQAEERIRHLETSLDAALKNHEFVSGNIQERQSEIQQLEGQLKLLNEENFQKSNIIRKMEKEIQHTETERRKLEGNFSIQASKLDRANAQLEGTEDRLTKTKEECLTYATKLTTLQSEHDQLEMELAKANQNLDEVHSVVDEEQKQRLCQDMDFQQRLESSCAEITHWKTLCSEQQDELKAERERSEKHADSAEHLQREIEQLRISHRTDRDDAARKLESTSLRCENRIKEMTLLLEDYKKDGEEKVKTAELEAQQSIMQMNKVAQENKRLKMTLERANRRRASEMESPSGLSSPSLSTATTSRTPTTPISRPTRELSEPTPSKVKRTEATKDTPRADPRTPTQNILRNDGTGQPPPRSILRTPRSPWIGKRRVIFKDDDDKASVASSASMQFSVDDEALEAHFSRNWPTKTPVVSAVAPQPRVPIRAPRRGFKQPKAQHKSAPTKSDEDSIFDSVFDFK